jgi:hypothetical protein
MTGCTTSARRQSLGLGYRFVGCLLRIYRRASGRPSSRPKSNRQRRFVAVGRIVLTLFLPVWNLLVGECEIGVRYFTVFRSFAHSSMGASKTNKTGCARRPLHHSSPRWNSLDEFLPRYAARQPPKASMCKNLSTSPPLTTKISCRQMAACPALTLASTFYSTV